MAAGSIFVHRLCWHSPYTSPPTGSPRVLAVIALESTTAPAGFCDLITPGGGYCYTISHLSPPPARQNSETLANVRRQRLMRRLQKQSPLFADQFFRAELEKRADYYNGITDEAKQQSAEDALADWRADYEFFTENLGRLIVYAPEPGRASG